MVLFQKQMCCPQGPLRELLISKGMSVKAEGKLVSCFSRRAWFSTREVVAYSEMFGSKLRISEISLILEVRQEKVFHHVLSELGSKRAEHDALGQTVHSRTIKGR